MNEQEVLERYVTGDPDAFKVLADRYSPDIKRMIYHCTRRYSMVDDILQEVLLRMMKGRDKFDISKSFRPWICKIAANEARSALRRLNLVRNISWVSIYQDDLDHEPTVWDMRDESRGPDDTLEVKEQCLHLVNQMRQLRLTYRRILILRFWKGLSYVEISSALKIPLGTVKSRLHHAICVLRGLMDLEVEDA